jgi:hypothetical protein
MRKPEEIDDRKITLSKEPIYMDLQTFRGHIQIIGLPREASKTVWASSIIANSLIYGRRVDIPQQKALRDENTKKD